MSSVKHYEFSISVSTQFVPDQSDVDENRYVFTYTVKITNTGSIAAQLISRHWVITDANQNVQEVRGLGVVGEQPFLKPGETFEYTSGTMLNTPVGTMHGSYHMTAEDGKQFDSPIPSFMLCMPRVLH